MKQWLVIKDCACFLITKENLENYCLTTCERHTLECTIKPCNIYQYRKSMKKKGEKYDGFL